MATTKISALTELTTPASADVLVINDDSAGSTKKIQLSNLIPDDAIDSEHYVAGSIDNEHLANDAVGIDELSATGTASSSTFLRGDNSWVTPTDTNTTYSVQDGELSEINFTSADHTKLNAIEASADVTDATNVTAAGALMDSELAGIAAVKATTGTFLTADQTKLDGIETSATADQTGAEIKTAYEAEANAYTDTKNTKLAGIETSATADQTAGEILTLIEDGIDSVHYVDASIDNVHLADDAVGIEELSATGTASSSTFLRGDNTWTAPTDTNTMGSGFTVSATTDSNATTITQGDDLMFTAGTGITCETTADGTVTITNTVSGASTATSSATGVIKIEDDTDQSVAAESVSTTANRTYGLQLNSSDQGVVNVPWTDTNTTYSAGDFKLDDLGAPDDNTDLNFTTSAHGLVPKGTNTGNFLKDDGTWAAAGGGIASLLADTTPQLGGDLDCNGNQIQWSQGADVASATALAVLTDGNYFDVTGTTTITSINTTGGVGTLIKLHFDGALTLTHDATDLILPGGANITTAAGDEAEFIEYATGDYRCTNYSKASGAAVVGIPSGVIAMWSGAISAIPTGWVICDGTNSTPDLTDRFVIHADADSGGTNDVGDTGGSHTSGAHTLSTSEMPSHTHTYTWKGAGTAYDWWGTGAGYPPPNATLNTGSTGGGGSHTHTATPKYYALAYIMKT
tara:strand:- start:5051 stop:7117 length:2067 start_codon:yes stop_codon:yes gene_type:complete